MKMTPLYEKLLAYQQHTPDAPAYTSADGSLTYRQLITYAQNLSAYLHTLPTGPIAVYGHKQIWMPICFLACYFSGRAYLPIDTSTPLARVKSMLEQSGASAVLAVEPLSVAGQLVISLSSLQHHSFTAASSINMSENDSTQPFYILFTSGSTGLPKGIPISTGNLHAFLGQMNHWLAAQQEHIHTILNPSLLSFDLSVAPLYYAFYHGKHIISLAQSILQDYSLLFSHLCSSNADTLICTPSFVQYCLLDSNFNTHLLPYLHTVLFCGEHLMPKVVRKLWQRFPSLDIYNAYGPTEATVTICAVQLRPSMLTQPLLPVGKDIDANTISISNITTSDTSGEIVLRGPQLSTGYLGNVETGFVHTGKDFYYLTGDSGYIHNGMLYCTGRLDRQIKLGGHRIELGEIEAAIYTMPIVHHCTVFLHKNRLVAVVSASTAQNITLSEMQEYLCSLLPSYMIPSRLLQVDTFPLTPNGKCDYAALQKWMVLQDG